MAHTGTSVPGGLGSLLSIGVESTYGTAVTPTLSVPILTGESLKPTPSIVKGKSIRQGRVGQRDDFRVAVPKGGEGSFGIEANVVGLGKFLRWMIGGTPTNAQQGATAAYKQTHATGRMNAAGTSLTVQKGIATDAGVVEPMTMAGAKCKTWEFGCAVDEIATLQFEVDARVAEHETDLVEALYPTFGNPFHWAQLAVSRGGVALPGVSSISIKGDNQLNVDRYRGNSPLKREPIETALRSVELTMDVEFGDLASTWDDILTDATQPWVVEFIGDVIASTYYETLRFTITTGKLKEDTEFPSLSGEEAPLSQSVTIESCDDGTNPLVSVELITTDTAF